MTGAGAAESTAVFLVKMCKTVRGYSGSCILATQDINDIFSKKDSVYGQNIMSACATKMFMKVDSIEARQLGELFSLTKTEETSIKNGKKGDILFCTSNGHKVPIHMEASLLETEAITTDRKTLERVADKMRKEKADTASARASGLDPDLNK